MRLRRKGISVAIPCVLALTVCMLAMTAPQGRAGEGAGKTGEPIDPAKLKKDMADAIKKGVVWLGGKQAKNGSWVPAESKMSVEARFPTGCTSLALFALLKAGVNRRNPAIQRGFTYVRENLKINDTTHVYDVAVTILALEALHTQPTKRQRRKLVSGMTGLSEDDARANFRAFARKDSKWMKQMIDWIVRVQTTRVWRYPMPAVDDKIANDASNAQYAMLALNAGRRLGFKVPPVTYIKVIEYFLVNQEKTGPAVDPFHVPGADFSILKLKKLSRKIQKELREYEKKRKKDDTPFDTPRTCVNPYDEFGVDLKPMHARGWSYLPNDSKTGHDAYRVPSGSMTTSGIAALVISKAALEQAGSYKRYAVKTDQAIRDGAAWIAHNFTVENNPKCWGFHYYYLYGLERSGVLSMIPRFGKNDWFEMGAAYLLKAQQADGSWPVEKSNDEVHSADTVQTSFALLFLCRATTPIINIDPEIMTGGDLFKKKEKK